MGLQAMVVNKNYMKKKKFFSELAKGLLPHVKEFLTHIDQTYSGLEKDMKLILKNKDVLKKEDSLAS